MRKSMIGWLLAASAFLGGCATPPQPAVSLSKDYFNTNSGTGKIGVVVSELPKVDTEFPGAGCLLCLAAASATNNKLTTAVQAWPTDELVSLKKDVAALLSAKGQSVVVIDQPLKVSALPDRDKSAVGFARKDFSSIKAKSGVDRLLVIDIGALGAWRNYAAYVPTGAPYAVFKGTVSLVDLSTHKLDLYELVDVQVAVEGNWDEPPSFPGVTNAYFQALEKGKDVIKATLKQ